MKLQLSQKFGEIFDDIGIKVFFGAEILRFSDRKEGIPTFTKDFLKQNPKFATFRRKNS
jgi:hypothetical protein